MLSNNTAYMELQSDFAILGTAGDGLDCATVDLLAMAESAKFELDRYFGTGNWYSSTLVKIVGNALARFPTEVPCAVLMKIATLLRSAGISDARRFSGAPARAA